MGLILNTGACNAMFDLKTSLADADAELYSAVAKEAQRQEDHIELIASENYTSPSVMQAQGSIMTNKYAEGYPAKRYYGGCEYVDQAENLAIERVKQLFDARYANVQPHSGSQANAAVYQALLLPGDTVLGMNLSEGGHLTHGSKVNFSGKLYHSECYGVDQNTGLVDYVALAEKASACQPKLIIAGFSAYSQELDWAKFREIADEVGAYLLADMAHVAGLVATGLYPSPLPHAHVVTSTTHKTLRGPRGGIILSNEDDDFTKKLNSAIFPGSQGGPLMHVIAAKAVAFKEALQPAFKGYQQQVIKNANVMADVFTTRGYPVVSGGTKNHLLLMSFIGRELTGKDAEKALDQAHITTNKNTVPGEPRSPFVTSGLRVGTPAVTTRGFKEEEMETLTHWMCDILDDISNEHVLVDTREKVMALCQRFPVYQGC